MEKNCYFHAIAVLKIAICFYFSIFPLNAVFVNRARFSTSFCFPVLPDDETSYYS